MCLSVSGVTVSVSVVVCVCVSLKKGFTVFTEQHRRQHHMGKDWET